MHFCQQQSNIKRNNEMLVENISTLYISVIRYKNSFQWQVRETDRVGEKERERKRERERSRDTDF